MLSAPEGGQPRFRAAVSPGVYPDVTEHGWDRDVRPALWDRVSSADILIVGTPLWLGEESSICRILIERLYAMSGERFGFESPNVSPR